MKKDEKSNKILYVNNKEIKELENTKKIKYQSKNNNNNKSKKLKIAIFVSLALLLVFAIVRVIGFFTKFQHTKIDKDDLGINREIFTNELKEITNIALLGVDNNGVSDAIIIASLNPTGKQPVIKLISIARDTLVKVYAKNKNPYYTKINEAYGAGGEETTLRTLNKNFNLNIENFISIEMVGFAKILDKLGGIDLEITKAEKDQINGIINTTKSLRSLNNSHVKNHGKVHLNGAQVVAFARIRKKPTKHGNNDDFGRGDRQREVISKVFEKIKQSPKNKMLSLIEPCLSHLNTSFTLREILKIAKDTLGRKYSIFQFGVPCLDMKVNRSFSLYKNNNRKSTVLYDVEYAGKMINSFIYKNIPPTKFIEQNPQKSLSSLQTFKSNYYNYNNFKKNSNYSSNYSIKQQNGCKNKNNNQICDEEHLKENNNKKQNSTHNHIDFLDDDYFNRTTYNSEKQNNKKQQKFPDKTYNNNSNNNGNNNKNSSNYYNYEKNINNTTKNNKSVSKNKTSKPTFKLNKNKKYKTSITNTKQPKSNSS